MSTAYVSPTGVNAVGRGSRDSPFLTAAYALSQISAPRTVILMSGTYGNIDILPAYKGTSSAPTIIQSEFLHQAKITTAALVHGIDVNAGCDYVLLYGLKIYDCILSGIKTYANYTTIQNCWIRNNGLAGIEAHNTTGTEVHTNTIELNGWTNPRFSHGIYADGLRHIYQGNIIKNNYGIGLLPYGPAGINGTLIIGNIIYGNGYANAGTNAALYEPTGITATSPNFPDYEPNIVVYNTMVGSESGIIVYYATETHNPTLVYNNIFHGQGKDDNGWTDFVFPMSVALSTPGACVFDYNLTELDPIYPAGNGPGFASSYYGSSNVISTINPFDNNYVSGTISTAPVYGAMRITYPDWAAHPHAYLDIDDPPTRARINVAGINHDFSFVTYPTLTDLCAAIDAEGINMTTTLFTATGTCPCNLLWPRTADYDNGSYLLDRLVTNNIQTWLSTVTADTAVFTSSHVGSLLYFDNSYRSFYIDEYISPTQVKVRGNAQFQTGSFKIFSPDFELTTDGDNPARTAGTIPDNYFTDYINSLFSRTTGIGALPIDIESSTQVSILHNITPERTLFCYVDRDADSLEVATYYKNKRLLPHRNIIGLPCVTDREINYDQYLSQIEAPILSAMVGKDIWAIVLGYKVPNIVNDNGELFPVCSLLQRAGKT